MFNVAMISGPIKRAPEKQTWALWRAWLAGIDLEIISDQTPFSPADEVTKEAFLDAIKKCVVQDGVPEAEVLGIDEEAQNVLIPKTGLDAPEVEKLKSDLLNPPNDLRVLDVSEWRKQRAELFNSPPKVGEILTTVDGSPAKLIIQLTAGEEPFIFSRCTIPTKVGERLGWFAQREDENSSYGYKIIMLPKAHRAILNRFPELPNQIGVKSLKVVRISKSGKSLLCEVAEF